MTFVLKAMFFSYMELFRSLSSKSYIFLLEIYQVHQEVSNNANIPNLVCGFPNCKICTGIDLNPKEGSLNEFWHLYYYYT